MSEVMESTGLYDSSGKEIHFGDHVRMQSPIESSPHGEWTIQVIKKRLTFPVVSYVTSQAGQVMPEGYGASLLTDFYEPKALLFALDLSRVLPVDTTIEVVEFSEALRQEA